jgi:hypothetical protein
MATAFYRATFEKQGTGSALAWKNCASASGAMLADQATLGGKDPSPDFFRRLTGDTEGGLTVAQVGTTLQGLGVHTTVYDGSDGYLWPSMVADLKRGKFMVASGDYSAIPYDLRGDKTFTASHAVFFHAMTATGITVGDPLNDGRRAGIPKGYVVWPIAVAREFVERLDQRVPGSSLHACVMDLSRIKARPGIKANVRLNATRLAPSIGAISGSHALVTGGTVRGESIGGNAVWYRVWAPGSSKIGYCHSSVVVAV